MSGFSDTFRLIQMEGELREQRNVMLQLRKYLAGSLCTVCGEPLGMEEEIVQNDDEETMHKHCEGGESISE